MKFGVREICNVVFRAKSPTKIGSKVFATGQPVLYIDSAKTSTLEGAATTVYAQGGRGNTRLVAWEGEKTLTFTVEDALISPIGLSILSGAGLLEGEYTTETVNVHTTTPTTAGKNKVEIQLGAGEKISAGAPIFVLKADSDGSLTGDMAVVTGVTPVSGASDKYSIALATGSLIAEGDNVLVDYYLAKSAANVSEIQIDAEKFAGNYYVEADTLFRRQSTGEDLPANITLPNVKIQSNFSFSMASTGDPSTFSFVMDAFPGYTYFDNTKKVLCVIQVIDEDIAKKVSNASVMDGKHHVEDLYDDGDSSTTDQDYPDLNAV